MTNTIEYGYLMHDAMRGLIKNVLQQVLDEGALPGDHHFYITFDTTHPDVEIADWLSESYESDLTVVIQHWYDNLDVKDDGFNITLNFGNNPEPMYIPYSAIKSFADPSVEFGLQFDTPLEEDEIHSNTIELVRDDSEVIEELPLKTTKAPTSEKTSADIVSLDSFRKS